MTDFEPFTLIEESATFKLFDTFQHLSSAKTADHDIQFLAALRKAFPEYIATAVPAGNCNLLAFALAGHATAELDLETDSYASWRGWIPSLRAGQRGTLGESVFFAKYHFKWASEDFILYNIRDAQYILKEAGSGESHLSHSSATDALIAKVGEWQTSDQNVVWVFDTDMWTRSKELYGQVAKAEWKNVILDEDMKKDIVELSTRFFDSKEVYEDLGVPWKRGVLYYGPPGNGKTISIKALMHTLLRRDVPIPTLYVKAAPETWAIRMVFTFARKVAPCLLVFEDIDTVVNSQTRSYFFNECDGLENNDGILMVASTNHLDRLDPGIAKRPSRFDRKYLFPLPSEHGRTLYCEYWRTKLQKKRSSVEFPHKLCPAIAAISEDFSFAYLQEAFVASLLAIARGEQSDGSDGSDSRNADRHDDLKQYPLWTIIKKQIAILREDMDSQIISPMMDVNSPCDVQILSEAHEHRVHNHAGLADLPDLSNHTPLGTGPSPQLPNGKYRVINSAAFAWQ